jgi:hypothetical protein
MLEHFEPRFKLGSNLVQSPPWGGGSFAVACQFEPVFSLLAASLGGFEQCAYRFAPEGPEKNLTIYRRDREASTARRNDAG